MKKKQHDHCIQKAITVLLRRFFIEGSFWMYFTLGLSFFIYSHAMDRKVHDAGVLKAKLDDLKMEKMRITEQREELLLYIQSQSDPSWIELLLKKQLGVVREGEKKIYFEPVDKK